MMRKALWIYLLLIVCISYVYPQPEWLKRAADNAQSIKVDKKASMIVLWDVKELKVRNNDKITSHSQIAYKVLNNYGTDAGTISLSKSPFLKLKNLKGWRLPQGKQWEKLSRDNIVEVSASVATGYYTDAFEIVATFPEVKPGDIVGFEYDYIEKGWTGFYKSFVFQAQEPVNISRYSVEIPKGWKLVSSGQRLQNIDYQVLDNVHTWKGYHLPYEPDEPLSLPWSYLKRHISLSFHNPEKSIEQAHFSNWQSLAHWYKGIADNRMVVTNNIINHTKKLTGNMTTLAEKIQEIARFSQKDIRYVAVSIGKGRWEPRLATITLNNRYGDCKDKTTLMRAMLKAENIPSAAVLANVNSLVTPELPAFQFDHCIVGIPVDSLPPLPESFHSAIVKNWLFFDPTDPTIELGQLPAALQGNRVLLAEKTDSVLIEIPYPADSLYRRVSRAEAVLETDGSFSAKINITDYGVRAASIRHYRETTPEPEQIRHWQQMLTNIVPGVTIENYQVDDRRDTSAVSFDIRAKGYLQKAGNLYLLHADIFHLSEKPKLTARKRIQPVWFGGPLWEESEVIWHYPEGWIPETANKTIEYKCNAASISANINTVDNIIRYHTVQRQNGEIILPEDYSSAKKFSKTLSRARGEVIVFKKQ